MKTSGENHFTLKMLFLNSIFLNFQPEEIASFTQITGIFQPNCFFGIVLVNRYLPTF